MDDIATLRDNAPCVAKSAPNNRRSLYRIAHLVLFTTASSRHWLASSAPAWDIFQGNDRIEYHDPDDREGSERKTQQDLWMCLLINAPTRSVAS
jgi:hypothetical protein